MFNALQETAFANCDKNVYYARVDASFQRVIDKPILYFVSCIYLHLSVFHIPESFPMSRQT